MRQWIIRSMDHDIWWYYVDDGDDEYVMHKDRGRWARTIGQARRLDEVDAVAKALVMADYHASIEVVELTWQLLLNEANASSP